MRSDARSRGSTADFHCMVRAELKTNSSSEWDAALLVLHSLPMFTKLVGTGHLIKWCRKRAMISSSWKPQCKCLSAEKGEHEIISLGIHMRCALKPADSRQIVFLEGTHIVELCFQTRPCNIIGNEANGRTWVSRVRFFYACVISNPCAFVVSVQLFCWSILFLWIAVWGGGKDVHHSVQY